jgi:GAF domain-containing protein
MASEFSSAPSEPTLPALLGEICLCLTEALPRAESAGVVIFTPDKVRTPGRPAGQVVSAEVIGMAPFAAALIKIETELDEGPALSACRSGALVTSGQIGSDERWSEFGRAVGHLHVNSVAAVPLPRTDVDTAAVLSVYSHHEDAFNPRSLNLIAALAGAAASALVSADMLERASRALKDAEQSRIVNQALGVLISQNCTEEQARMRLARMTRNGNQDMAASARMIVDEARKEARLTYIASRRVNAPLG